MAFNSTPLLRKNSDKTPKFSPKIDQQFSILEKEFFEYSKNIGLLENFKNECERDGSISNADYSEMSDNKQDVADRESPRTGC